MMNLLESINSLPLSVKIGGGLFLYTILLFFVFRYIFRTKEGFQETTTAKKDYTFTIPINKVCYVIQNQMMETEKNLNENIATNNQNLIDINKMMLSGFAKKFEELGCVIQKEDVYDSVFNIKTENPLANLISVGTEMITEE